MWSHLIESKTTYSRTIQCFDYSTFLDTTPFQGVESKFRFVELSPDIASQYIFKEPAIIFNSHYIWKGLFKHNSCHFTCAVYKQNICLNIDELTGKSLHFHSLDDLYIQTVQFYAVFAIYEKVKILFMKQGFLVSL